MKAQKSSTVAQLNSLVEQRDALERQIQSLQKDAEAITDVCEKVKKMAKDAGISIHQIAYALVPELATTSRAAEASTTSKKRAVKIYKNPNGETIETKGGNHKLLKQWKALHGAHVVEGWRTQ